MNHFLNSKLKHIGWVGGTTSPGFPQHCQVYWISICEVDWLNLLWLVVEWHLMSCHVTLMYFSSPSEVFTLLGRTLERSVSLDPLSAFLNVTIPAAFSDFIWLRTSKWHRCGWFDITYSDVTWAMAVAEVVDGCEAGGGVTLVHRSSRSLLYVLPSLLTYPQIVMSLLLLYASNTRTSPFEPLALLLEPTSCCWSVWLLPAAACWPSCCCCCCSLFCFRSCCSLLFCCTTTPPCWSLCLLITWQSQSLLSSD